jgi:hypothetical protein
MSSSESQKTRAVPIEWHTPAEIVSRYASNLVVQHTQHEFIISFFEVLPPILLGLPEERQTQLEQIESVQAQCVARIVVAANRMPEFVKVLQDNVEQYLNASKQEK